jgi:hypothetical protein
LADTENPSHVVVLGSSKLEQLENLKSNFFKALHSEIEKISLFTIKKQGELADAVGGARFESTGLFDKKALNVHFTRDKLDMYAAFSVELAHLVKYICINSIGIQKILKKYSKAFARLDEPHFYFVESNHLKQLASSESTAAIHASLQTLLDDSYQAETVNNPEAALALLRFQCILACTTILRRNATIFQLPFVEFLSKQSMIATEVHFGGMDAKGQRALRWLLRLEPQRLRQMDQAQLESMWHKWSVETEIVRSYLDGGLPYGHRRIRTYIGTDALDAMLDAAKLMAEEEQTTETTKWIWGGVNGPSMLINLFSILLYTINYYIVAPTANHYAIGLGYDGAFGATLIGASSFSAIFSAFLYSLWYTRSNFKSALIFSAICPFLGNLIYAIAISYDSMTTAIIGRILCGFGSAEVLNRQLISTCVSFEVMTKASALFVAFGASGMSIGPLIAGILDMTAGRDFTIDISLPFMPAGGIIYNHVTAPGFVMAVLWSIQLLCLLLFFEEPNRVNTVEGSSSDEEASFKSDPHVPDNRKGDYGSIASSDSSVEPWYSSQRVGPKEIWQEIRSTCGLIFENSGLPITLLIFSYIEMADEIIISSCSMIVKRYFSWHGSVAGFFIASLGALVLPAHFVVEKASHHFSERRILLVSRLATVCLDCAYVLSFLNSSMLRTALVGCYHYVHLSAFQLQWCAFRYSWFDSG